MKTCIALALIALALVLSSRYVEYLHARPCAGQRCSLAEWEPA
jgi:hypothetical protein